MSTPSLRHRIACEAARLLDARRVSDFFGAKRAAARAVCGGWARSSDLPTDLEVREALQRLVPVEVPEEGASDASLRYAAFATLLEPLESIHQPRHSHPEGDVLYHSLQVYELIRQERPYDIDLQLAALLHDVGKGIDPSDHVAAGLAVLEGLISERTAWLIEHHLEARRRREGTLGVRAARRLLNHESYEELDLLWECDRDGRVPGAVVPDLDEALNAIHELELSLGDVS